MLTPAEQYKMQCPTMLYKYPGAMLHGQDGCYDYIIVDGVDVDNTLADGWYLSTAAARESLLRNPDGKKPKK